MATASMRSGKGRASRDLRFGPAFTSLGFARHGDPEHHGTTIDSSNRDGGSGIDAQATVITN